MTDPTTAASRNYFIDPDGEGGLAPFTVYCDMTEKHGVGVTCSHQLVMTEGRTYVTGRDPGVGCYSRDINYTGVSLPQLASLTKVSWHCEQFIEFECNVSLFFHGRPMDLVGVT